MFGSNQKLDFTDIVSDHNSSTGSRSRWGGCYVKTTTGFILAMLAICIAVGVGLIVHFAGNSANKPVQCNCKFLDSVSTSGGLTTAVSHPDSPRDPLKDWLECEDLAVDRNRSMCDMCFTTTAVTTTTASSDGLPTAVRDVRLPTSLEPLLYEVELQPNIYEGDSANFSFDGFVRIQLLCKRSTRNITLHMNQLTLQNSTIQIRKVPPTPSAPSLLRYEVDKVRQFCIFHLDGSLKPGSTYTIEMRYSGPLKDDLAGLYLSSYMRGNQTVYMATTQFQPTDARRAFPCFDEPAIKSKFKVTLVRKAHMTSLSNMPRTETVNRENGFVADIYNTTAKMSTYLLAFIICDFKSLEQRTKSGVQYRVWARPEAINQAKFALDVGVKILDFYEKYFNIEFPLPKQDMIAIPDFSAGAMENWGLITYRETAMLYEPGVSSEGNKQRVATVVSHELAHQWFGNLVSPAWWDDLWLNEGFATYLEYIGVDTVFPEWKMLDQFVNTDFQTVLSSDGLLTSHPLYVPVFNPNEINEIFDQISYNKGASIVRMMKFFLSENTFRNGLTNYLRNLSYAAATHDDLWKFLAAQSHTDGQKLDVKNIMDTWTLQMNYPVVTVTREGENQLFLTQERFLMNPNASSELKYNSTYGYRWEIPITYTTSKEKNFEKTKHDVIWMKHEGSGSKHTHSDLNLPPVSDKYGWIIANIKQYGYYRVNYEKKNWRALITQMDKKHKVIHPINRAQIINDAWNLARANLLDQEIALETLEYLDKEEDLNVWSAAVSQMSYLDTMLQFTEAYGDFRSFKRKKFIKLYKKLGWNNTGAAHLESFTRSLTAAEMCELDDSSCVKEAQSQFRQWMTNEDENPIDPGLKFTAYCTAIRKGGVEEWDFAYRQYKRSNVASEKRRLLSALSCSRKSWILNKYLQKSLLTEEIRKQDATSIIIYVSRNPVGRSLAWVFVQSKWEYIRKTFGQSFFSFSSLINGITHSFNTKYDLEQLNEFQSKHKDMGSGTRAFQQALERTQTNIDWMEKNFKVVQTWLENQADSDQKKVEDLRLPKALEPISYQVELKPDIYGSDASKFSFDGFVRIHVRCKIETANVTIHIHKLTLKNNSMHFGTLDGSSAPSVSTYEEDEIRQFLIVYLSAGLKPGAEYFISMNFTGPLKNDLVGLYLSSYARADRTVYLAASQLQATHARKTFPCFDEPAMKATFNVTLLRQPNMTSLSNMPVDRSENRSDGYVADIYLTTPKMSTYLMAFIICDFEYRKNITANGAKFQVWSRAEAVDQTAYSLDIGVKVTEYFEKFFDIPYNLPKQDMIAIPDFSAGAMENWGLITYRESVMLYKKGVSARENQQFVALVVSHELAHMWFGNLVTLEWWDDVWLNEGFATYLEYFGMDSVHPEWKMFDQFVADMHVAFEYDQLASSHPLHVPVNTPNEISEIFDAIEYTKGSCILRMLKLIIGDSTFQNSLRLYLKSLLYKSTTYDKLWDVIQQQLDKDGKKLNISKIMNTWILQMNFPVVKISQTGNHTLAVSQKRFLLDTGTKVDSKHVSPYGYKWEIPLTFTTSRNGIFTTTSDIKWISADQDSRNITDVNLPQPDDSHGLIIGNVGQYGYYRVNYEDSNWYAIIQQLKDNHKLIDINNRAQIINDAWNLAKAGMLSQKIALGTVEYLDKEEKYIPWKIAMREMGFVKKMLGFTSTYGLLQKFMVTKIKPLYKKIGWGSEDDDHLKWYLRQIILELACEYGMPDCIQQAKRLYKSWMNNERQNTIAPDLRYIVYCIAIKDGGIDEWDFAYRQYKASNVASERLCLLSALACSVEPWILSRYLERSIDPNEIKRQDASIVIVYISRNSVGRSLAWNFVLSKWNFLIKSSFLLSQLLSGITVSFNTETDLQKLTDFENEQHDLGGATRALAQAKEKTRGNIKWMKNNYGVIKDWLQSQTEGSTEKVTDVRLPTSLEPELYRLELKPDIYSNNSADFRFEGSVTIEMLCKETTSNITVHANNLDIQKDSVKVGIVGSSKMIQIQQQMEDKIREFYIVALTHNLTAGERYFIQIRFSAPLKANLYGLYLSSYKRENKTVYLATTQFQPTHARKAFPCFDEPAIKARFDVTLVRKSNMISLANTKINTTVSRSDNYVADLYTRTAKMSTYLLAFVVCDFTNITRQAGNITFSVWARQEVINQSRFALDIGINIITYFEKYFGISYPLAKQDMIAIPDFASGAMENWGLITYREIAMLYDEGMSSLNDKQTVAIVVSHELAHQWFGNLVTPAWWDDLWLNEGFASYMEYVGVDHAQPKWKMFEQFTIETVQSVLSTDSLASSHPVYVPVAHANEISEIFDSISYSKGASIIRMMKFFLGEDKFRSGLTLYLTNLSYAAAFHDDLWKALSQASDMNVKKIMDTWTLQMNYPVVTIKILEAGQMEVTQERYLLDPSATYKEKYRSPFNYRWEIPFTFTSSIENNFNKSSSDVVWIHKTDTRKRIFNASIPASSNESWVVGNIQQYGFYRVNYEESNWRALIGQLKHNHGVIDTINRAQLINDAWNLAKSGHLMQKYALGLLEYLENEEDYVVWNTATGELNYIGKMLSRSEAYGIFQNFIQKKTQRLYNKLGWNNSQSLNLDNFLRYLVIGMACKYGAPECVKEAVHQYKLWMNDTSYRIDPNLRSAVYCIGIREGGAEEWNFAYTQYHKSIVATEKVQLLISLTCSQKTWILSRYLQITLDPKEIRRQDVISVIAYISWNHVGRSLAWDFVRANWDKLNEKHGSASIVFPYLVTGITHSFNTVFELDQFHEFMDQNPDRGSAARAFSQAEEVIRGNIKWMKENYELVSEWLTTQVKG